MGSINRHRRRIGDDIGQLLRLGESSWISNMLSLRLTVVEKFIPVQPLFAEYLAEVHDLDIGLIGDQVL